MDQQRLHYLFQRYFDKTASDAERDELMLYVENSGSDEDLFAEMQKQYDRHRDSDHDGQKPPVFLDEERELAILRTITGEEEPAGTVIPFWRKKISAFGKYAAALAIFLVLSLGVYYALERRISPADGKEKVVQFAPGSNKAYLTLSDGTRIVLDEAADGEIASLQGIRIVKQADGKLLYEISSSGDQPGEETYHTITTPRGGQYQVKLPDGTQVWLNAASSLRYPAYFGNAERRVELEGEGYFEVAKDPAKPFRVISARQHITVLGTHFNINSYKDEQVVLTTVLEGRVRVNPTIKGREIPGVAEELTINQQSVLETNGAKLKKKDVEATQSIAWKAGKFEFHDTPISEVMRQFSRWYNFDFELEGSVPDVSLWGELSRNVNASEALEILKFFDLQYRLKQEGDKPRIIVSNKK